MSNEEAKKLLPGLYEIRRDLWERATKRQRRILSYEVRGALKYIALNQR